MPYAPINGTSFYYEDTDPQDQEKLPILLFLHGAMGNSISFWQNIPELRKVCRCICFDCRGYGRSVDPTGEGLKHYIGDLEAFVEHLNIKRLSIIAQSMGGRTALGYTCRHPDRVAALIMAANWGGFDWPEQVKLSQACVPKIPVAPGKLKGLASKFQDDQPALTHLFKEVGGILPGPKPALSGPTPGGPTLEQVRGLQVPVLCVVGDEDAVFPPPVIKAFADVLPKAKYVEVPGCGHSVYFEKPARFNQLVLRFLVEQKVVAKLPARTGLLRGYMPCLPCV
mmetsp:Transcript_108575/g.306085  ORF Transcript_108575/g.306085 Transcript_108575/m.306085 type:complete len:282 (-) Transcript_108575:20-865(-)